jgi:DNA-directed RNA polymerase subunit M/transcription elongation factor TFIIS|uniref:DNA-directed RNA polymerase M/15kDa subunit domain-containing protein n=1 Tax=viral metagenome TaxID=1070528 RepID=A0A6C0LHC8_9ZZZZ
MKFCQKCDNMYYLKIDDNEEYNKDDLVYYCRNCGDEHSIDNNATNIMKTVINGNNDVYVNVVNKYTKYDNTIPRVNDIQCSNSSCPSHEDENVKDVLLIRHDEKNLKYIYLCGVCDNVWKSDIK